MRCLVWKTTSATIPQRKLLFTYLPKSVFLWSGTGLKCFSKAQYSHASLLCSLTKITAIDLFSCPAPSSVMWKTTAKNNATNLSETGIPLDKQTPSQNKWEWETHCSDFLIHRGISPLLQGRGWKFYQERFYTGHFRKHSHSECSQ